MTDRDRAIARLMDRVGGGARLGLARMQRGLRDLGDPHKQLTAVHVAGTNGKGSVCAMVASIACAAGQRVGSYTSPHLCRFNERIQLDGEPIDDARFASALSRALDVPSEPLSFFETLTAAAFLALRDARVDLAVVEVGLGGRLDATNVLDAPACTAITSIGRDHTRVLGKDLASIAVEKAGILRPGVALVCGPMATEAQNAIRAVARRTGAGPVWWTGEADGIRIVQHHERLELRGPDALAVTARVSLAGAHQQNNAAVAAGVAWQLPVLRPYLAQGLESVRWPGRLERLSYRQRVILLDCGHNEDATRALLRAVDGTPTLLFGAMEDKPWRTMLELLAPRTAARFYVPPIEEVAGRRPADVETLAQVAGGSTHATITDALDRAITETKIDATLLVTGSAYLVGAVRALVLGIASDARVPL